ncbi:hypothetical protein KEM56_000527 [Ascosphaera pollenicola]|nr:hypothetical protein KEM56_000527 [Ascosphaera pollenicola]
MTARRSILLTLDAFDTLYQPRVPVALQYLQVARSHNLTLPSDANESKVWQEFYKAFKAEEIKHPIYGRAEALRGLHQGPREWWGDVIRNCLQGVMRQPADTDTAAKTEQSISKQIPEALVDELYERFNSAEGYSLYDDVIPFFTQLRALRKSLDTGSKTDKKTHLIVAVVTNSDGRVDDVLRALDLKVGTSRQFSIAEDQPSRLEGEADDINYVLSSYEVGFEKPHPKIFEYAADIAASPQKMSDYRDQWYLVHVGDHFRKDGEGALLAGWDVSMILQREADSNDAKYRSEPRVTCIKSLLDVMPFLKRAVGRG